MLHREARDRLALVLRRLANGRLTARAATEKTTSLQMESSDPAVREICDEIYWAFLNFGPNRFAGPHSLSPAQRRVVSRWILFLQSAESYGWQPRSSWDALKAMLHLQPRHRGGDLSVWPFINQEQLAKVASQHPFTVHPPAASQERQP